ncbi:MAG TPA: response regulator [Chitinophagaceae bacterium]|nr:response regulator [Chitinophagaceae bacterium]
MAEPLTVNTSTKKKILIVEDEGEICLVLNILLNGEELELDHVNNILDADEYLKKVQPDVMILDNRLPDGFGIDFLSYVKKHYPSTRVIMMSGVDAEVRDVALESGADWFLEKPFNREELYRSVRTLLN